MERLSADLLVIGFGKAGKTLAATMGRRGARVIMVEQSAAMYGGTCINIACVPTKALVHDAATRPNAEEPAGWYARAVSRKDGLTSAMRAKNFAMLDRLDSVTIVTGHASFAAPREVDVRAGGDHVRISATTVVINTGSTPRLPPISGVRESKRVHTSTSLLDEHALPRRLVIVGGGYVGLEFASMYRGFGSEVTVLESGTAILQREDDDVAQAARGVLDDAGVRILTGASATAVTDDAAEAHVAYDQDDRPGILDADAVLVAVGRRPETAGLNLEAAGVEVDERGAIVVDEFLRTTSDATYAAGDVNGGPQFTYVSLDDYRIVLDQLIGPGRRSTRDRVAIPHTVFLTPPLSTVGMTERDAVAAGRRIRVARRRVEDMATMPRPRIVGDARGFMKVVIDAADDRVLGASLLCIDSQEVINLLALAIRSDVTASRLRDGIWIHPSTSEGLNELLGYAEPTAP